MALVYDVTQKIRNLVPDSETRWSDTFIQKMIHLADCSIRDECETTWATADISLIDDVHYYALPADVVQVAGVEMSLDGTNFDDGILRPTTYDRLDELNENWLDDRGTQPRHFLLLGTPGIPSASFILVYPAISSVTNEAIRINYIKSYPENSVAFSSSASKNWLENAVYVPYVLSLLYAPTDKNLAMKYWAEYTRNVPEARSKYQAEYGDTRMWSMRATGPTMTEGDI